MKSVLAYSGRVLLTAVFVVLACVLGWHLWDYYMNEPWTRDGKVRADVVSLASDVSGFVSDVDVKDDQTVKKGDVIFRIDRARFDLALREAQAQVDAAQATLDMNQGDLELYQKLGDGSITRQKIQDTQATVAQNKAALEEAVASRDTAQLNLDRTVVRAPVNGIVTNFSLRPGNYVNAGSAVTALIDGDSYYVAGYFEENKLDRIKVGDTATITLMGGARTLKGHVTSVASGIEDRERSDTSSELANVTPTFTWVRLAQRVPVRITLDNVTPDVALVAGRTASVTINN